MLNKDDRLLSPFRSKFYEGNTNIIVTSQRSFDKLIRLGVRDPRLKYISNKKVLTKPQVDLYIGGVNLWKSILNYQGDFKAPIKRRRAAICDPSKQLKLDKYFN